MYPKCRHLHVTGRRCGSPALRDQPFCYFHTRSHTRHRKAVSDNLKIVHELITDESGKPILALAPNGCPIFDFPPIEDRESIQVAVSMIVNALGRNVLDPKRAASILYALQIATAVTRPDDEATTKYLAQTDPVLSPDGPDLAPIDDTSPPV